MRLLLTGHLGYIGVEMASRLVGLGHDVVGLDIDLFRDCDFQAPPEQLPVIATDLRDVTPGDLEGFDAVVHLAALSNDPLGDLDPALTFDINFHASVRLARAAKQAGVERFLFSSSCSLYGKGGEAPLDEDAAFFPLTPYGESKVFVERELGDLADADFCPTFLRNATAYGLSRRLRADIVVNNLVGHAITSGRVELNSDGAAWRPLVHIDDIIHAFATVLDAPADLVRNEAYNVGRTTENYQVRKVAEMVVAAIPGCEIVIPDRASTDARDYRVDCSKIESQLPGYHPQWTLARGIDQLAAAYAERMSGDDFRGAKYVRLRRLQERLGSGELTDELRPVGSPIADVGKGGH